jgi:hypothetical protein
LLEASFYSNIYEDQMSRKVASPLSRCRRALIFGTSKMERFSTTGFWRENILFLPLELLKLWKEQFHTIPDEMSSVED